MADLCHRLNLSNYQTVRARDAEVTAALGICLPSVVNPKFNEILIQADGLLIDEISAVLREVRAPADSENQRPGSRAATGRHVQSMPRRGGR